MNSNEIENRLYTEADAKLKAEIKLAVKVLHSFLCNAINHTLTINLSHYDGAIPPKEVEDVPWFRAIEALEKLAFEIHQAKRREQAVDNFFAAVKRLSSEIDELNNSIPK